jgi:nicotinate (nicotinamide) nucleotide adenylyltransferase
MTEAIYGGAFDPPTLAHQWIVKELSRRFDRVAVVPTFKSRDKKEVMPYSIRLNLCGEAFESIKKGVVYIDDTPMILHQYNKKKNANTTFELLKAFRKSDPLRNYKTKELYVVIGYDRAIELTKFYRFEDIKNENFVIFSRGTIDKSKIPIDKYMLINIDKKLTNISSTLARNLIGIGDWDALKHILDKKLIKHIKRERFYT